LITNTNNTAKIGQKLGILLGPGEWEKLVILSLLINSKIFWEITFILCLMCSSRQSVSQCFNRIDYNLSWALLSYLYWLGGDLALGLEVIIVGPAVIVWAVMVLCWALTIACLSIDYC
jgi:hypothetical protein